MSAKRSNVRKLFSQSSHYALGTALSLLSHLVTFPVFTRIFSVADYGILSLITVTISTVLAISKLGMTTSAVRMYEECHAEDGPFTRENYFSTFFLTACATASLISLGYAGFVFFFYEKLFNSPWSGLFLFTSLIVCFQTVSAVLSSFLRAGQQTKLLNSFNVIRSYAGSGLAILLALYIIKGLWGFYTAQLLVEFTALIILFRLTTREYLPRLRDFSLPLLKTSLAFGLPLVGLEFLNHILTFGDRFLIQLFCTPDALGIYSVGYNLASYISNILLVPLSFAVTPVLMETWTRDGREATRQFLGSSTRYVALVFFPVLAGFIAVRDELLLLLASAKYSEAGMIIPFAVVGVGFFALSNVFNAGLIIHKRTGKILLHSFIAAVLNILLNLVLIPKFGIIGAAVATVVAYGYFFGAITRSSFALLSFPLYYQKMGLYFFFALVMAFSTSLLTVDNLVLALVCKILLGIIIYSVLVLCFDGDIRKLSVQIIKNKSLKGILPR